MAQFWNVEIIADWIDVWLGNRLDNRFTCSPRAADGRLEGGPVGGEPSGTWKSWHSFAINDNRLSSFRKK
jgi:hypothetical protein